MAPNHGGGPYVSDSLAHSMPLPNDMTLMAGQHREILDTLRDLAQKLEVRPQQGSQQAGLSLDETHRAVPDVTIATPPCEGNHRKEIEELYRELEGLEHELNCERERAASLAESLEESEESRNRDIAELEGMLKQVCTERDRLAIDGQRLEAEKADLTKENLRLSLLADTRSVVSRSRKELGKRSRDRSPATPPTPEYVQEPEMERSSGSGSGPDSYRASSPSSASSFPSTSRSDVR